MSTIILEESALCEWCDMFQTLLHFGCWVDGWMLLLLLLLLYYCCYNHYKHLLTFQ